MDTIKLGAVALAAGAAFLGQGASAQGLYGLKPQGYYLDAAYSFLATEIEVRRYDDEVRDLTLDSIDYDIGALNLRGGFRLNEVLGVELEGAFGATSERSDLRLFGGFDEFGDPVETEGALEAELKTLFAAYGVAYFPLGDRVNLHARAGYVRANVDLQPRGEDGLTTDDFPFVGGRDADKNESGVALGVGGSVGFADHYYLRGDYTLYDLDDNDLDGFSLGAGYLF